MWGSFSIPGPALLHQLGGRIVVQGSAQVFMARAGSQGFRVERQLAVERAFQNRFQTLVREDLELHRAPAGGLQPGARVDFLQAQDAQAGAITHLRVGLAFQNGAHELGGGRAHSFGPMNQPRGTPFPMSLVTLGHVFGNGGVPVGGVAAGVAAAHLMFSEPVFFASQHVRSGSAQLFSEFVATFGLLSVIWGCVRLRSSAVPFAVGAYITSAYWFTASTSFANPAVTLARAASDTFAGIRPIDAPGFIVAQLVGAAAATVLFRWLVPSLPEDAPKVVVEHP